MQAYTEGKSESSKTKLVNILDKLFLSRFETASELLRKARLLYTYTVDVQNRNVWISDIFKIIRLLNSSDFGICLKTEPFRLDFRRLVCRPCRHSVQ